MSPPNVIQIPKRTTGFAYSHFAFFLIAVTCLPTNAAIPPPLKLLKTISLAGVDGPFDHMSIDTRSNRLFVAALNNDTLEVVDLAAGKRIQSITGMSKPTGVLYLPGNNQVAVANGEEGTFKLLDGNSFKVIHNLGGLRDADNLRLDPRTGLAWLGYGNGSLGSIDAAAPKVIASVKLSDHPESFQLEKHGSRIFVNIPAAKQIAVIDAYKHEIISTWPMERFQDNFPMALDESNHRLFVGCRRPPRLVVLDTGSGKVTADLAIEGDADDLFYDSKRKRLYISCGQGLVNVIGQSDANSYAPLAQIPTAPGARTSLFSPDLDEFYLAVPQSAKQRAEIRIYQAQD